MDLYVPSHVRDENCTIKLWLHSPALWNLEEIGNFFDYALPRLLLQFALIFLISESLRSLFKNFNLPRFIYEIMAGLILGKTVMGRVFPSLTHTLFPEEGQDLLDILSMIGILFFMFIVGVKMSATMMFKTGYKAWFIGISAICLPQVVAAGLTYRFEYTLALYRRTAALQFLRILTLTPFPVIATLVIDLKIMNSELGRVALASTMIGDLTSYTVQAIFVIGKVAVEGWKYFEGIISLTVLFFSGFALVFLVRPFCLRIIKQTPEGKPVKGHYVAVFSCLIPITAIISNMAGYSSYVGPFILGLSVPAGPPLGSALVDKLDIFVSGLLVPLLMAFAATKVDLLFMYDFNYLGILWSSILIMFVGKLGSTFFPALLCKMSLRDAAALSFIMCTQGIVQLEQYHYVFKTQSMDDITFSSGIMSTFVVAILTYISVRFLHDYTKIYTGYQKRNIVHTPNNAELRVLACSHRQDDATAAIKLLEVSNISIESPITAYALYLVELVGQATPLLINHRLGQKVSTGVFGSRSQQIINVFQRFQEQYSGMVNVQIYIAASLPQFMHHDICSLAFDKLASLIILPFHRKWNQQGKLIFDNKFIRTVNCEVMDMAPCSVGVLVDRRKLRNQEALASRKSYQVGVVFLGGEDDREALAYGKRMSNSSGVQLTVVRIIAQDDRCENLWDTILDTEALKDAKVLSSCQSNVVYKEEKAKDGTVMMLIIKAMEDAFDLIIVGRHHREDLPMLLGLSEWSDFPELGVIGDMLSSSDIQTPLSVLVVQQQLVKKNK